jgi:hypothetical protein
MTLGIITSIQQSELYQRMIAGSAVETWMGRGIEIVKVGSEKASPYFQNRLVAVISLLSFSILFAKVTMIAEQKALKHPSTKESNGKKMYFLVEALTVGSYMGGIVAFSKFTHLPLGKLMTTGLAVAGVVIMVLVSKKK